MFSIHCRRSLKFVVLVSTETTGLPYYHHSFSSEQLSWSHNLLRFVPTVLLALHQSRVNEPHLLIRGCITEYGIFHGFKRWSPPSSPCTVHLLQHHPSTAPRTVSWILYKHAAPIHHIICLTRSDVTLYRANNLLCQ